MFVEVVADVICPWCYIGKRRLERALAAWPDDGPRVRWRAYQLNPDMPTGGMDRGQYMAAKFGGAEEARQVYDAILVAGLSEGIGFEFSRIQRTPNTLKAHRMVFRAAADQRQDETVEALFRGFFFDGRDIGDTDVLVDIGASVGFDADELRAYLETRTDEETVRAEDALARQIGIAGVPTFVVNRKFVLSGAQEPDVLLEAFRMAAEDGAAAAPG